MIDRLAESSGGLSFGFNTRRRARLSKDAELSSLAGNPNFSASESKSTLILSSFRRTPESRRLFSFTKAHLDAGVRRHDKTSLCLKQLRTASKRRRYFKHPQTELVDAAAFMKQMNSLGVDGQGQS